MKSDEELDVLVNQIATDSTIQSDDWPDVLQYMLKRLDWIAYNSFPLPKPPPLLAPKPPVSISRESTVLIQSEEESNSTENRDSSATPTPSAPTVDVEATQTDSVVQVPASSQPQEQQEGPPSLPSTQSTTAIPSTQPPNEATPNSNQNASPAEKFLPPTLLSSLNTLTANLSTAFPSSPPHTIQRFAELLLKPTKHYRSLAKFLRACHRTLSVTSGIDKFPLPMITHDGQAASNAIPIGSGLVNDQDEGATTGATLTPIPWASAREYVANNGVDAAGSPVSDEGVAALVDGESGGGVSQGELLRKEQEAGVVTTGGGEDGVLVGGPPELDAADVGPQPEGTVFGEKEGDKMDVDVEETGKGGGGEGKDE